MTLTLAQARAQTVNRILPRRRRVVGEVFLTVSSVPVPDSIIKLCPQGPHDVVERRGGGG
jgi:hypothetical protein